MRRTLALGILLGALSASAAVSGSTVFQESAERSRRGAPAGLTPRASTMTPTVTLLDLDDRPIDPFRAGGNSRAIVFLFTSVDCPISNRYAPVVKRLHATFAPQRISFWLVYPNPAERPQAIRDHTKAFDYPVHALRDPKHELVRLAQATVTPEVAVYDGRGALVYHGRIDNRYVSLGVERPSATEHDLEDVLVALVAGKPSFRRSAPAVGCYIADFVE
jgi:hypothetical protein